jgi:hypothetical protein
MENNDIKDLIKKIREAKSRVIWSSKTINAETRKLKTEWTRDMSYDIAQYSGIDSSVEDALIKEIYNNLTDDDRDLLQLYGIKV